MRVLLLSDFYPPHLGGVELQVQALARELVRRGHAVTVATLLQEGLATHASDGDVSVLRLSAASTRVPWFSGDGSRRYHPPFPDPVTTWQLGRLLRRLRPDVVQAHGWIAYSAALAAVGTDIPLILSVRDYGYTCATRTMLLRGQICSGPELAKCLRHAATRYGPLKSIAATAGVRLGAGMLRRRVSAVHSVSRYVAEVTRQDLLRDAQCPIVIIPDIVLGGVASHAASKPLLEPDPFPTRPYILFVGALQPHKGLGPLFAAYAQLRDAPPLVLIGTTWPDTPKHFPDGVTVVTNVAHAQVMAAWDRALFGVAPAIWPDPLPGVVREAMIAGRPVIGSSVGGIVDMIVDGENGLLVPPGDVDSLAAAMQRLVDDPSLRESLGIKARESALVFDGPAIAERFEGLYASVIDGRGPS